MEKDYSASTEYSTQNIGLDYFRQVSHLMPFLLTVLRAEDFRVLYVNEKLETLLGFSREEVEARGGELFSQVAQEDVEKVFEAVQQLLADDTTSVKFLTRVYHKNGHLVHLESTFSVFRRDEATGAPLEYLGLSEDVSQRIELENSNRQLEQMVKLSEESFRFGKWEYRPDAGEVFWSPGILDIFGIEGSAERAHFSLEEYRQLLHPEDLLEMVRIVRQTAATGEPYHFEYRIRTATGIEKMIREHGRPIFDEQKRLLKIIGISWDITAEHRASEDLKKYATQLSEAEASLNLGTWEWDMANEQVKWSAGYWNLLEYPSDEQHEDWIPVQQFYQHLEPDDEQQSREVQEKTQNLEENQQPKMQGTRMRTREGNLKYIVNQSRIVEWKDGKPSRSVGFSADMTQMRNIQKSLENKVAELAKSYSEAEQFAYVASHDLQEPLRKITSFGERLQMRCGTGFDEDCKNYLARMLDGTARMRVLIENLLTLSRTKREPAQFKPTDLNQVLVDVQADLELSIQEIGAEISIAEPLPTVEAIPFQVQQLFQNLLTNALKFSKKGEQSKISVACEMLTQKQKYDLNLDLFTDFALVRVADNGIGFEPQYAEAIFTPFKRLHGRSEYAGTGIGLAICKKVVQNHRGMLWAESVLGEGAVFFVVLPLIQN